MEVGRLRIEGILSYIVSLRWALALGDHLKKNQTKPKTKKSMKSNVNSGFFWNKKQFLSLKSKYGQI